MFIRIDRKTGEEASISSEEMAAVLEADLRQAEVDEALTEMVLGTYRHQNASATFIYRNRK